jgi:MSHA biogenesis protein MshJ
VSSRLQPYVKRFNAQSTRERALVVITVIALLGFSWWNYYAKPMTRNIETRQQQNRQVQNQLESTRVILSDLRQRIAVGVHQEKRQQLVKLRTQLQAVENQLRAETVELIDPEKMLQLMTQLIYRESRLELLSLRRREVKPAIPRVEGEGSGEPGIYRHVLEIELAGKYADIVNYMQTLEGLDWKLLWDEIEVKSDEHPRIMLTLVMSTLSTRKEWIGI